MSFRNRLTFFFILLVILPVLAVASVGLPDRPRLGGGEERRRARAGAERRRAASTATRASGGGRADGRARTTELAIGDPRRRPRGAAARLEDLAGARRRGARRLKLRGEEPIETGSDEAVAPSRSRVVDADGRRPGDGPVGHHRGGVRATCSPRVTGFQVVLTQNGRDRGTLEGDAADACR